MKNILLLMISFFLTQTIIAQGLIFDQKAFDAGKQYESERADFIPSSFSLKAYAPYVMAQKRSTCVAYASASALAIVKAISKKTTDPKETCLFLASPHWIYYRNKDVMDSDCLEGLNIEKTMVDILNHGAPPMIMVEYPEYFPFSDVHLCNYYPETYELDYAAAAYLRPDEIVRINNLQDIKSAISQGLPIVFGMSVPNSFEKSFGRKRWTPATSESKLSGFGHAMVIVGYDDKKYGGAVEVLNSWGQEWGDSGYIWISYSDFNNYFFGAYAIYKETKYGGNTPTSPNTNAAMKQNDIKLSKANDKKVKVDKKWKEAFKF